MSRGSLFKLPERATRENDTAIAKKVTSKAKTAPATIKGGGGLIERINTARALVEKNLGKFREQFRVLYTIQEVSEYIDDCIKKLEE